MESITNKERNYIAELLSSRAIAVEQQIFNYNHGICKNVRGAKAILYRFEREAKTIESILSKLD